MPVTAMKAGERARHLAKEAKSAPRPLLTMMRRERGKCVDILTYRVTYIALRHLVVVAIAA
jgi:hypothetical protein